MTLPIHPWRDRHCSVNEWKLLMGTGISFVVRGSLAQKYEQLGNGLPPQLSDAVCGSVAESL